MIDDEIRAFLEAQVRERFDDYVRVHTTSDENQAARPTTARQLDLLRLLERECAALDLADIHLEPSGFLYATLPAREGASAENGDGNAGEAFSLLAHVDTSPEQPGGGVVPVFHEAWDGDPICFPDDPDLVLSRDDCPELACHVGHTIITASGKTLLGADDKAGIAEIMAAVAALRAYPQLPHGEIRLCFTSDEEVGRGVEGIDLSRMPVCGYTVDGGGIGGLQHECFDAWGAHVVLHGVGVHPGSAKDKLVNAAAAAARLVAALPPDETPERTDGRDGFYYVYELSGGVERAEVKLIVRDFDRGGNEARLAWLRAQVESLEADTPGLRAELTVRHQYPNMAEGIARRPDVLDKARQALRDAGLEPLETPIRGGTDGSLLAEQGHPTPNLFTGGHLGHSRREWVAVEGMVLAAETLVHLAHRWVE